MQKIDLVMWVKNGARTLPAVLDRLNNVVPGEVVNQRLMVDDGSVDSSCLIAKFYGWRVISNEGQGISDGANTALKYVETDCFASFEQDVFLASDWWCKVSPLFFGGSNKVAAASGLRFLSKGNFCFSVDPYTLTRRGKEDISNFGKTLDNTIWSTCVLRECGGFPKLKYAGIDTYLHCLFASKGYEWLVNYDVQSLHLHRNNFFNELQHYYFYGLSLPELYSKIAFFSDVGDEQNWFYFCKRFMASPVSSSKMALKMRDVRLLVVYPGIRFCWLIGYLKGNMEIKL